MKNFHLFVLILSLFANLLFSQVSINTTGNNPDASAGLDVSFTNKGVLIPRIALTGATDNTTIPSPATSLLVYNTGTGGLTPAGYYYWNGSQWVMIGLANHTHATLSNGTGIAAFSYNGSSAATVAVNFGTTAGTVAEGNHTHTGMVTGSGTTNYNAYWTSPTTLGAEQYVAISRGGTGLGTTPANGQLLIGNGTGYTLNTLTAGSGVSITNGSGTITISATGSGGTVTSISAGTPGAQTGSSGLTFSPNPITGTGTIALSNTGVTAGTYGNTGANIPNITVDAQGRLTAASNRALTPSDIGAAPSSHTHATLTPGNGLSGTAYNGSTAQTWTVNFGTPIGLANSNIAGTSNQVARADHQHKRDIRVSNNGTDVGIRNRLNLIQGSNVTLTIADDATNDEIDVTISATTSGGTVTSISAGTPGAQTGSSGLTFSPNPITGTGTIALSNTGVTAGIYGNTGANVPNITVDAQGRLTAASNRTLTASDLGLGAVLTFNNSGAGGASGTTYNGTTAQTISYNTIGAVGGSGAATRVAFWNSTNTLSSNANLYWDNTNSRLGIGTSTPGTQLDVVGTGRFGLSTNGNTSIGNDGNAFIEMRENDNTGTPYIDFSNDNTSDYDARIILEANNQLSFHTSTNGRQLSIHSTGIALSGTNKYLNFNNTFDAAGYGFRDNNGILEYKHSGGIWTPFSQPPSIPGNTEWWVRPTGAQWIQPMYNANARVYDANQTYGFYYDGSQNQYGGYFRVTGTYNPTAAVVGFSDITGNQTYGYLGYRGDFTFGTNTIYGSAVYGVVDDPGRVSGFFRTTLNASFAANVNYSNVWIAGFNSVDNASATYNPCALYGELNLTNSTLGGWHIGIQSYTNRGTTTGNPGYTVGGYFTADAQNEDAYGVTGVAYTDQTTRAGGYFESFNFAGTSQAYAYVGTTVGGTARKITGTNSVSEIIPTENHGRIMLTCPESPEYWYIDYGTTELKNGKAIIELDPILADIIVVNQENPIRVFCTPVNMLHFNGVAVTKRTNNTIELTELNGGTNSGTLDYQLVVKPKTNYGEGRFPQAPGPAGLKVDPPKARAKNQPDPSKIFRWPSDEEVYGYKLERPKKQSAEKK